VFQHHSERVVITGLYDEHSDYQFNGGREDVDPVSMAYEIWRRASAEHPQLAEQVKSLPNVVYASKEHGAGEEQFAGEEQLDPGGPGDGVLVHSQTVTGSDAFAFSSVGGEARRVTPQEALRLARCEPHTPPADHLDDHHALVARALDGPLRTPPRRATGSLLGVRAKCWQKLRDHRSTIAPSLLFSRDDLDSALDAVNDRPLLEAATQKLSGALRERKPEDLAALIVDLHRGGQLCVPLERSVGHSEPSVVCSMGLRVR